MAETDPLLEEFTYPSMFGEAEVFCMETEDGEVLRALYVGGGFQSVTYLGERRFQAPFAYCRAFDEAATAAGAERILVLGGGAYSYPKHALTLHDDLTMDVVEIDPAIIDIARKHFYVAELEARMGERLSSFACDGLQFLCDAEPATYDAIVNDSFAGTLADAPLLTPEALCLAKAALAPGGVYLLNIVAEDEGGNQDEPTLDAVRSALRDTFQTVAETLCEDEDFTGCINHVFCAR